MRVKLVVLGHYEDINAGFRASVEQWESGLAKILIRDGQRIPEEIEGWTVIDGPQPFSYSRNVNLGWTVTGNADVILCGDDIRFDSPFVDALQRAAYSDPTVGISTVQLHGQSPFVCGLFKREMLDKVGKMDESFTGYGYDDSDFCKRMELAGYHTLCTEEAKAHHGGGATFFRRQAEGGTNVQESCDRNRALFNAKWGTDLK
jgi:hypothetical protein